jgi:hypothetical protein
MKVSTVYVTDRMPVLGQDGVELVTFHFTAAKKKFVCLVELAADGRDLVVNLLSVTTMDGARTMLSADDFNKCFDAAIDGFDDALEAYDLEMEKCEFRRQDTIREVYAKTGLQLLVALTALVNAARPDTDLLVDKQVVADMKKLVGSVHRRVAFVPPYGPCDPGDRLVPSTLYVSPNMSAGDILSHIEGEFPGAFIPT